MKKKRLSFEQFWMKKNNVKHKHSGRFVATSHRRDREFLGLNRVDVDYSTTQNA